VCKRKRKRPHNLEFLKEDIVCYSTMRKILCIDCLSLQICSAKYVSLSEPQLLSSADDDGVDASEEPSSTVLFVSELLQVRPSSIKRHSRLCVPRTSRTVSSGEPTTHTLTYIYTHIQSGNQNIHASVVLRNQRQRTSPRQCAPGLRVVSMLIASNRRER